MSTLFPLWSDLRRLKDERQLLIVAVVSVMALLLPFYAPIRPTALGRMLIGFGLPLLSLPITGMSLRDVGFRLGSPRRWLRDVGLLYVGMLPFLLLLTKSSAVRRHYSMSSTITSGDFWTDQLWTIGTLLSWEFVCRGYLMLSFEKRIGAAALAVQLVPFVLLHIAKPLSEVLVAVPFGIVAGVLSLRERSFLPGAVLHSALAVTFAMF
ncbi:MAG: CPBP family intramembrane glutamic endopeptidase [Acidobacteriota bacterium]